MQKEEETGKSKAKLSFADDYCLCRVEQEGKMPTWKITILRLGALVCITQFLLGATLGYGMTFNSALLAVIFGSVILQVVGFAVGVIAAREGLTTSLIARWAGFGKVGSALIGLIMAIAIGGWFAVQNELFAKGMYGATKFLSIPIWTLITGGIVILIVIFGIKMLAYVAYIALPAFLISLGIAAVKMFSGHDFMTLLNSPAPGPALALPVAISMVAGAFMIGAVITPDIARFLSKGRQVFWMVLISTFVGELTICLIAVLMAHTVGSADIMNIMISLAGLFGGLMLVLSILQINNANLYIISLNFNNSMSVLFNTKISRAIITVILGVVFTLLSTFGVIKYFVSFLMLLGAAIPPIAGIVIVDYFVFKRDRNVLNESKKSGGLPSSCEIWNPIAMVSWVCAFLVGYIYRESGVSTLNSLIVSAVLYFILMKIVGAIQKKPYAQFKRSEEIS